MCNECVCTQRRFRLKLQLIQTIHSEQKSKNVHRRMMQLARAADAWPLRNPALSENSPSLCPPGPQRAERRRPAHAGGQRVSHYRPPASRLAPLPSHKTAPLKLESSVARCCNEHHVTPEWQMLSKCQRAQGYKISLSWHAIHWPQTF